MFFCKSEICNYSVAFIHENVGQFKITMKKSLISHFNKSTYDIFENFNCFRLSHSAFLLDQITQIALIAKLSNDVTM